MWVSNHQACVTYSDYSVQNVFSLPVSCNLWQVGNKVLSLAIVPCYHSSRVCHNSQEVRGSKHYTGTTRFYSTYITGGYDHILLVFSKGFRTYRVFVIHFHCGFAS